MSTKVYQYSKQKMIYSIRSSDEVVDRLFPNIKAMVRWFADQTFFPHDVMADYDRIVRTIRSGKKYVLMVGTISYSFKQIPLHGVRVNSAKRSAPAADIIEGVLTIQEFADKMKEHGITGGILGSLEWKAIFNKSTGKWMCFRNLDLMQQFDSQSQAEAYLMQKNSVKVN